MDRVVKVVVTSLLLFLLSLKTIFAVTIKINNFPSSVTNEPFEVSVSIEGAKSATNYLRIEIFKDGTSNYFGETFNGKDWYGGSDGLSYFPIEVSSSTTSAVVKGRISENYQGKKGEYKLKVKRYTASGNSASDTQNPVNIQINYEVSTPTSTLTPTPTSTIVATETPSPKITSASHTPKPSPMILAVNTTVSPSPLITKEPVVKKEKEQFPIIEALVFAIGLVLIGLALFPFVANRLKVYNGKDAPSLKKNH